MSQDNPQPQEEQVTQDNENNTEEVVLTPDDLRQIEQLSADFDANKSLKSVTLPPNIKTTKMQVFLIHPKIQDIGHRIKEIEFPSDVAIDTLPDAIFSFTNLEKIDCWFAASLQTIPEDIKKLTKLKQLYLSRTGLKEFPRAVLGLEALEDLSLHGTQIADIPDDITKLQKLQKLSLRQMKNLTKLPEAIFQLPNLKSLYIGENSQLTLTGQISTVSNLRKLQMSSATLPSLGQNIDKLVNLTKLRIGLTDDTTAEITWPDNMGLLRNLTCLVIAHVKCAALPDCITQLAQLEKLELAKSDLGNLPKNWNGLKNLKSLKFNKVNCNTAPEDMSGLRKLEALRIHNSKILDLPNVATFQNLHTLELRNSGLTKIPEGIGSLSKLKKLDVSGNQDISVLPNEMRHLTNLETFYCSDTRISELPQWISRLSRLQTLDISRAQLAQLPESMGKMYALERLYAHINPLTTVPARLFDLPNLVWLNLSKTQIVTFPTAVSLQKLEYLFMDDNLAENFPWNRRALPALKDIEITTEHGLLPSSANRIVEDLGILPTVREPSEETGNEMEVLKAVGFDKNPTILALLAGKYDDQYSEKEKEHNAKAIKRFLKHVPTNGGTMYLEGLKAMLTTITNLDLSKPEDENELGKLLIIMDENSLECPTPVKISLKNYYYQHVVGLENVSSEELMRLAVEDWIMKETGRNAIDLDKGTGIIMFSEDTYNDNDDQEMVEGWEAYVTAICLPQGIAKANRYPFRICNQPYTTTKTNTRHRNMGLHLLKPREYRYTKNDKEHVLEREEVLEHNSEVVYRKFCEIGPDGEFVKDEDSGCFKADPFKFHAMISEVKCEHFEHSTEKTRILKVTIERQKTIPEKLVKDGYDLSLDFEVYEKFDEDALQRKFAEFEKDYIQKNKITDSCDICETLDRLADDASVWNEISKQFLKDCINKLIDSTNDVDVEMLIDKILQNTPQEQNSDETPLKSESESRLSPWIEEDEQIADNTSNNFDLNATASGQQDTIPIKTDMLSNTEETTTRRRSNPREEEAYSPNPTRNKVQRNTTQSSTCTLL